jgi:hypothetical protein
MIFVPFLRYSSINRGSDYLACDESGATAVRSKQVNGWDADWVVDCRAAVSLCECVYPITHCIGYVDTRQCVVDCIR